MATYDLKFRQVKNGCQLACLRRPKLATATSRIRELEIQLQDGM